MKKLSFPMEVDERTETAIRDAMREPAQQPWAVQEARLRAYEQVRAMAAERQKENDSMRRTAENNIETGNRVDTDNRIETDSRVDTGNAIETDNRAGTANRAGRTANAAARGRRRGWRSWGSIAAAIFSGVCVVNPAFAARIPLVGHVFEQIGDSLGFRGNFEKYAKVLDETDREIAPAEEAEAGASEADIQILSEGEQDGTQAALAEATADGRYSKTVNGMTVTLSEVYCNEKALYLSMVLETEDVFPETMLAQNGHPVISILRSTLQTSYRPGDMWLDEAYLDGKMVDAHTFAGMLRVDLDQTLRWAVIDESVPEEEKPETDEQISYETTELPEDFSVSLHIPQIIGELPEDTTPEMPADLQAEYEDAMAQAGLSTAEADYAGFTEEQQETTHKLWTEMWRKYAERYPETNDYPNRYENWWVDGPWDFDLDVHVDHSETITRTLAEADGCPIGDVAVTRTPFEIVLDFDWGKAADYFVTVLDADGIPMESGGSFGGAVNTMASADHDVSSLTVYVCDYDQYMDELKGYWYADDYEEKAKEKTYRQVLDENCVWSGEVSF